MRTNKKPDQTQNMTWTVANRRQLTLTRTLGDLIKQLLNR